MVFQGVQVHLVGQANPAFLALPDKVALLELRALPDQTAFLADLVQEVLPALSEGLGLLERQVQLAFQDLLDLKAFLGH